MNKVFIFSLCGGSYEYAICFIQAESLKEAVEIGNKDNEENKYNYIGLTSSNNIQGFNYDYKDHIAKFTVLNYMHLLPVNHWEKNELVDNHELFNKTYDELLLLVSDNCKDTLLNNSEYIIVDGDFYDVMEVLMPVPKGYIYSNGHSG